MLLGAPTGSGKTISAELAMLRAWRAHPGGKVIYIAPLKVHLLTDKRRVLSAQFQEMSHPPIAVQVVSWVSWGKIVDLCALQTCKFSAPVRVKVFDTSIQRPWRLQGYLTQKVCGWTDALLTCKLPA